MTDDTKYVSELIKKAAAPCLDAGEAMKFAQAALNAANAIIGLVTLKKLEDNGN